MKKNKVLRIVIPVNHLQRAKIKQVARASNRGDGTIAGWCREILLSSAEHAQIEKGV